MTLDKKSKDIIDLVSNWVDYMGFSKRIPSVSVGIIIDDKLIFNDSYGFKNLKSRKRPTKDTAYRIASISKIFTTVAILQLSEQGKLSINDRVSKHLDWFKSKNYKDITIRQLLFHCSGLSRENDSKHWNDDEFPGKKKIINYIKNSKPIYRPMKNWKYSNLGFSILGMVIEQVSGKKYNYYVTDNIIKKLGLKHTEPDLSNKSKTYLATGYSRDIPNQKREAFDHINTKDFSPATGFLSTVEDLSKFLVALFNDKSILSNQSKKEMRKVHWKKDKTIKWGLGLRITKLNDITIYGHSGGFPGYQTSMDYSPEHNIGVIVLTNSIDVPASLLINSIFNMITHIYNNYDSYKAKGKIDLEKYTGRFGSRGGDSDIRVINDKLIIYDSANLIPFEECAVLEHIKDDTFVIKKGDEFGHLGETVKFIFENGKVKKVIVGHFEMTPVKIKR